VGGSGLIWVACSALLRSEGIQVYDMWDLTDVVDQVQCFHSFVRIVGYEGLILGIHASNGKDGRMVLGRVKT
jgi:hypothetical protein